MVAPLEAHPRPSWVEGRSCGSLLRVEVQESAVAGDDDCMFEHFGKLDNTSW
jgi:hypothetical protein